MTVPDFNTSFDLLVNGSMVKAASYSYTQAFGVWFWPILFLATLGLLAIKTRNLALISVYAIIGNIGLAALLPIETSPFFYVVVGVSAGLVIFSLFGSASTDNM